MGNRSDGHKVDIQHDSRVTISLAHLPSASRSPST